jgi:hypothetical protein
VRLGLRLTLRPNGNKPADSQTEDQSAVGQGQQEPAVNQADDQQTGTSSGDQAELSRPDGDLADTKADHQFSGAATDDSSPWPQDQAASSWSPDSPVDSQTESFPAVSMPEDVPALSHEEYLPSTSHTTDQSAGSGAASAAAGAAAVAEGWSAGSGTGDTSSGVEAEKWSAGNGTGDGSAGVEADMRSAEDGAAGQRAASGTVDGFAGAEEDARAAEDGAAGQRAASGTVDGFAGAGAEAWSGSEAADQTAVDEAGERAAGDPSAAGETGVAAGGEAGARAGGEAGMAAEGEAADQPAESGADGEPAAARTAVPRKPARRWDLGLAAAAAALWQRTVGPAWERTVGRAWQQTIGRLGISRLWQPGPGVREAAAPGTRTLALVTAMPVILVVAWLVPGLLLLLVHGFLPAPMVLISVPLAVALTILVARELPGRWPAPDATDTADTADASAQRATGALGAGAKRSVRPWAAWWGLLGTVAVAAGFAVWQLIENSPQFIVSRDPGAFAQFAFWIADHGSLPIPTSAAAFGGAHPGLTFASFGFASHGGALVPGLAPGLPIALAAGMWAHGVSGAIALSPLIGALAILAVGGLTARLAGPQWAPAGALLLAITVPEIYTSRSAFSVTLAQALLFGGLSLVVDSFSSRRRITLASLGGLALGLTVLAGTSFLLLVLPVIVVAGALLAGRRPQAIPLAAGWLAGVVCGLAADVALDAPALSTTTPSFRIIGILAGGLAVVTAAGAAIALAGPARRRARKLLAARPMRWLPEAGAALVAVAGIGLAIRPYVQKVHGPASPYVAALQRLQGLPVDPGRVYAESSVYWVIWYLGLPALLLGLIGLAMVTRMCLRALVTRRDPTGAARSWVLPASIIGWGLFAVLWAPGTVPDQPWASRQLVPVVLPGLIVMAVWVAAWMIGRAHARGAGRTAVALATACFVVAMGVPPAAITFGIALSRPADPATRLALSGLAFRTTGAGQVAAVEQLCGAIPPHSSVVLLDTVAARAFAQVIRGTCGVPTGIVTSTAPGNVSAIIGGIVRAGRHPVLLATKAAELTPYGAPPREIVNLSTQQDEHLLTRPPTSTWPVRYSLWMSQPGGTAFGA